MRNIAKTSHSPRNRPLIKKSSAGIVAHPKQVAPFENMMEYPPLQHIATMVVSHNGELKEPFDIIEAFIFSVRGGIQIYPEGVEPRLCHSIPALPAHAAIPRTYQLDIDKINKGGPTPWRKSLNLRSAGGPPIGESRP
jgi:hypothetical protein